MSDDRIAEDLKRAEVLIEAAMKPDSEWRIPGPEEVVQEGDESRPPGEDRFTPVHPKAWIVGKKAKELPTFTFRRRVTVKEAAEALEANPYYLALRHAEEKLQQAEHRSEKAEALLAEGCFRISNDEAIRHLRSELEKSEQRTLNAFVKLQQAEKDRDEARISLRLSLAEMALREKERDQLRAECDERRVAMADIVRDLGCGYGGLEHHEIAPKVRQLRAENESLLKTLNCMIDATSENERLREALEKIAKETVINPDYEDFTYAAVIAQKALTKGEMK